MSVVSPKVQHMAMPAPLSISASGWGRIGTSTPYTGRRPSCRTAACSARRPGGRSGRTQAASSSGRVVSMHTSTPSSTGCARGGSLRGGLGVRDVEGQAVVEARVLAALQLSLGDRSLEGDVPQARGLGLVGLAARQVAQERGLGDLARTRADRLVVLRSSPRPGPGSATAPRTEPRPRR